MMSTAMNGFLVAVAAARLSVGAVVVSVEPSFPEKIISRKLVSRN